MAGAGSATVDFKDYCFVPRWFRDGGVAFDTSEQRHFPETSSGLKLTNLCLNPGFIGDANIKRPFNGYVEGVSSPLALTHDFFVSVEFEQPNVGSYAFSVAIITALYDDFEIAFVLLSSVLFVEKFRRGRQSFDRLNNALPVGDFARHVVVILNTAGNINIDSLSGVLHFRD